METVRELFERVYRRLYRHRMRAKGLSLKIRYSDFRTITRSMTLDRHTNEREEILEAFFRLFNKSHTGQEALRLVGVSLEKLTDTYWQPTFWD